MALNLAELQQKADRVIHNADEFVRRWVEFISAPAGNVTLEYYDRDGNLQTVTFSNRNKLVNDFIGNVNNVMNKTVYVDQVNGNDANDGSQNAPFATIEKAIESVPEGAFVTINILTGTVYELSRKVDVGSRKVVIRNIDPNGNPATIRGGLYEWTDSAGNVYAEQYSFMVKNGGALIFRSIGWAGDKPLVIETANYTGTGASRQSPLVECITMYGNTKSHVVFAADVAANIQININTFAAVGVSFGWPALFEVIAHAVTIQKNSTAPFIDLYPYGVLQLVTGGGTTLQDSAGNALTWADMIGNILYDATATTVPLNVISNADL